MSRARTALAGAVGIFLLIEPLWTLSAAAFVFLAYLLNMNPALPWVGIGLALLPFPVKLLRGVHAVSRTPFDIPVILLMIGAIIGWQTSPNGAISLGALQCMVAISLWFYSWVNYNHLAGLMRWTVVLTPVPFLAALILFVFDPAGPASQPNFVIGGSGTHHGLALYLAILGAVIFGMGLFGRSTGRRVLAVVVFVALLAIVLVMTWDSLGRLIARTSLEGRLDVWEKTAALLADSPFSGLGLGCWAVAYHGTDVLHDIPEFWITHAHNAYLELYANTGALGLLALFLALVIGTKASLDIITSPRSAPWYGFGVGVILACLITLLVGVVESAPVGVPLVAADTYYYFISPVPWILCALLLIAHRLVTAEDGLYGGAVYAVAGEGS